MANYSVNVTTDLSGLGLTNLVADGSTDNAAAFNALFDYVGSNVSPTHPLVLDFPAGDYGVLAPVNMAKITSGGITLRGLGGPNHAEADFVSPPTALSTGCSARIIPLNGWSGESLIDVVGCSGVQFLNLMFDDLKGFGYAGGLDDLLHFQYTTGYGSSGNSMYNCTFAGYMGLWGTTSPWSGLMGIKVTTASGCSNQIVRHCSFTGLQYGVWMNNTQAYWWQFEHNRFYKNYVCYEFQNVLSHRIINDLTMSNSYYIRVGNPSEGVSGLQVDGPQMDSRSSVRTKIYTQAGPGEFGVSGDNQGRPIGPVTFRGYKIGDATGYCRGVAPAVVNAGGYCQVTLDIPYVTTATGTTINQQWAPGDQIRLGGFVTNTAYNTRHTITSVTTQGYFENNADPTPDVRVSTVVATDIQYGSDETGTWWVDGTAMFRLRGGTFLNVEDSMLGWEFPSGGNSVSASDCGQLIDMEPGDRYYGYTSWARFARCWGIYGAIAPTLADLTYSGSNPDGVYVDGTGPDGDEVDVRAWENYIRFEDCFCRSDTTLQANYAPWSCGNFGLANMLTETDVQQLRYRLGIDGTAATPAATGGAKLLDVDGKTLQEATRIIAAMIAGKITTAGEATERFLGLDGVTERVTVTASSDGDRSPVVYTI